MYAQGGDFVADIKEIKISVKITGTEQITELAEKLREVNSALREISSSEVDVAVRIGV